MDHCDTELCLSHGGDRRRALAVPSRSSGSKGMSKIPTAHADAEQKKAITLFYEGKMCVSDVSENQAREIICMARREMESMKCSGGQPSSPHGSWPTSPAAALVASETRLLNQGLSMRRSLQRFLLKRKTRSAGAVVPPLQ